MHFEDCAALREICVMSRVTDHTSDLLCREANAKRATDLMVLSHFVI